MIRLGHVEVSERAKDLVMLALNENKIGQTDFVTKFEDAMAAWLGVKYAVAVSSGTMADTAALAALKHLNPGKDEVIVPALTFIAQVNAIHYNHLKPVFVDVRPDLLLDRAEVETKLSSKTLCVFPVHLLGRPHFGTYSVPVIEDSCEAMGTANIGWGTLQTYSFFPSHTLTTGEGGLIATNNKELADLCRKFINHGKVDNISFHFDAIGYNGKMSSVNAALGLGMTDQLDSIIKARQRNYRLISGQNANGISPHAVPFRASSRAHRDAALEILRQNGIECRNLFSSIPTQEAAYAHLGHRLGEFPIAERVGDVGLCVPVHHGLTEDDCHKIRTLGESLALTHWE